MPHLQFDLSFQMHVLPSWSAGEDPQGMQTCAFGV